jgi:hypothetical protein
MTRTENDKSIIRTYDSINEVLELSRTPTEINKQVWQNTEEKNASNPSAWYGIPQHQEKVRELISLGWTDGAQKLEKRRDNVQGENLPEPVSMKRRRKWSDSGDVLDITRTYAGSMEAWQKCERMPTNTRRYVEILCNLSINSEIRAETIFYRGAAALILADMMTNAGYAVKIAATVAVGNMFTQHRKIALDIMTVKDYSAPLDIQSLASVLCLAGFFRLAWFQLATTHIDAIDSSLGSARRIEDVIDLEPHQVANIDSVNDQETARQWIQDSIAKIQTAELMAA